jgi:hypothetical protein
VGISNPAKLDLYGNTIFAVDTNHGVEVVDVSVPLSSVTVGHYDIYGITEDVDYSGGYLFVAMGGRGVHVLDIIDLDSSKKAPQMRGFFYGQN